MEQNQSERVTNDLKKENVFERKGDEIVKCRICLKENYKNQGQLIKPCNCIGVQSLVHLQCLERWMEVFGTQSCNLCKSAYSGIQIKTKSRKIGDWIREDDTFNYLFNGCMVNGVSLTIVFLVIWTVFLYTSMKLVWKIIIIIIIIILIITFIQLLFHGIKKKVKTYRKWNEKYKRVKIQDLSTILV